MDYHKNKSTANTNTQRTRKKTNPKQIINCETLNEAKESYGNKKLRLPVRINCIKKVYKEGKRLGPTGHDTTTQNCDG